MKKILFFLLASIFFCGCQTGDFQVQDGIIFIKYDASKRGAFFIPKAKDYKIIVEPSPDVGTKNIHEALVSGGYKGVEAKASYRLNQEMVELGQRTETVYLLREALFRLNILSVNYDLPVESAMTVYKEILLAAKELVSTDKAKAESKKIEALNSATKEVKSLYIPEGIFQNER